MTERLHCIEFGHRDENRPTLVLLHGFGGIADAWQVLGRRLADHAYVLAFDLPGHGKSASYPDAGPTKIAAQAVLNELDERDIARAHFCGHSMGGAVSSVLALMEPDRVSGLTLLAAGGFGHEINSKPLFRFAKAKTVEEIEPVLEQFYGFGFDVPDAALTTLVQSRRDPAVSDSLQNIAELHFGKGSQGVLPRDKLFALPIPIQVVWGTQDNITPTRHAHKLPGHVASHVFDGVGHMVHEEVPDAVASLLLTALRC